MDRNSNPYATSRSVEASTVSRWGWPRTPAGTLFLSLTIWPLVGISVDIVGTGLVPLGGDSDFGLAISIYTVPISAILGVALWFRGFLMWRRTFASGILALLSLPFWALSFLLFWFVNFPPGRLSSNF